MDWIELAKDMVQWRTSMNVNNIKGGDFLDQLTDYQLFKNDSVSWR
jgi:hypothetical protein